MQNLSGIFPGKLFTEEELLREKLGKIKAVLFDWDGVFNSGKKQEDGSSDFNEVDSMGTNLLRYSLYTKNKTLPLSGIISGERNTSAFYFSKRECFHYSFYKLPNNKKDALNFLCSHHKIDASSVLYFFDDVLDLSIAETCGVRIMVDQKINPLFKDYCIRNKMVDYLTSASGGDFAVREGCEFIIGMNGHYDEIITNRKDSVPHYQDFLKQRQAVSTKFFTFNEGSIREKSPF